MPTVGHEAAIKADSLCPLGAVVERTWRIVVVVSDLRLLVVRLRVQILRLVVIRVENLVVLHQRDVWKPVLRLQ